MPQRSMADSADDISLDIFERIAKEGRKYGVSLVVISQRPSEVNKTMLSQCSSFVSMRLTNAEDQGVIKRLLPDSLGGFSDILPTLDTGEALVVGDAKFVAEPDPGSLSPKTNRIVVRSISGMNGKSPSKINACRLRLITGASRIFSSRMFNPEAAG